MSPLIFRSSPALRVELPAMVAWVSPFTTEIAAEPATPTSEAPTPDIVWVEILCPIPSISSLLPSREAMALKANASKSLRSCGSLIFSRVALNLSMLSFTKSMMAVPLLTASAINSMVAVTRSWKSSPTPSFTSFPFKEASRRSVIILTRDLATLSRLAPSKLMPFSVIRSLR